MNLSKPDFWDKEKSFISILFIPFSLIVLFFIFLRKKFTKQLVFKIPIICIGNIYIGGTGKTPTSIFLANELVKIHKNPVILRKYYKEHRDEHGLIQTNFKNLILSENRIKGLREAERKNYDSVILDDGFQDYHFKKDLSIICFNQNQLVGNGFVLPAGPLRESLNSLNNADIVLINGKKDNKFEEKILNINKNLKIFYSYYKMVDINHLKNKNLLVIAGIGNPENFFQLISKHNLNIQKKLIYPDHYLFNKNEIKNIVKEAKDKNYKIAMTEKDYFKIKDFDIDDIECIKVSLEIIEKEKFVKIVEDLYDKKN